MRQVIYAWNYLEWGGAQVHFLALIKEARKEFDIAIVVPRGSDPQVLKFLKDASIPVIEFEGHAIMSPVSGIGARIRRRIAKARSEFAMLRAIGKFDLANSLVHVELPPHSSLFSLMWLALRTRVFITSHNAMPPAAKWREMLWKLKARTISRFANFNVFCSNEDAKSYFSKQYSADLARRIEVTYTSVDPDEIDQALADDSVPAALRERFHVRPGSFVVIAVGNFIDRKGRWTFLDAAHRIASDKAFDSMRFLWLTPTLPDAADMERIGAFGLGERFQLIESSQVGKERQDILRFFRIADVFALPSFVEGLPIALLEAMALGLPSISTNVYAIPEALRNNETGILIEAGDDAALAEAVLKYYRDSEFRLRMARAGSEHVRRNFVDQAVGKRAVAAYKRSFAAN
jgi:glycosyltransferase involved in cell wall biosynthesis